MSAPHSHAGRASRVLQISAVLAAKAPPGTAAAADNDMVFILSAVARKMPCRRV